MISYSLVLVGIVLLVSLIICILPKFIYDGISYVFSFGRLGVRKIRKWRVYTDTLGNYLVFLSLLFSIFYSMLPGYKIIYAIFIILAYLCCIAQANLVCKDIKKRIVIFIFTLIAGVGFLGAEGFFNSNVADSVINQFWIDQADGKVFEILYVLQNRTWIYLILQGILFIFPLFCLWSQFKYMRTEKMIKAANIVTFIIKMILVLVVIVGLSTYGFDFIDEIYQVDALSNIV